MWTNDTIFRASCKISFTSKVTVHPPVSIHANSTFPFNSLRDTPRSSASLPSLSLWHPTLGAPRKQLSQLLPSPSTCRSTAYSPTKISAMACHRRQDTGLGGSAPGCLGLPRPARATAAPAAAVERCWGPRPRSDLP